MRRSRRAAAQDTGAGDASAAKKMKTEDPEIDGLQVRFEWEGDKSKWMCYSKKFNRILVKAYNDGQNEVELDVPGGATMVVLFYKMVQKNKKTGWERRIRMAVKDDKADDFKVAEWQDDAKKWNFYTIPLCIQLEKAAQAGKDTVTITSGSVSFDIDFKKKTQANSKTKFSRAIRRGPQASDLPPDYEDEENGTSATSSSAKVDVKKEDKNEEEEEETTTKKSGKGKGRSGASTKSTVRTVVVKKGAAPVDDQCPLSGKSSVFESGKVIWDCMLNQTNISNNNNKYYLIQLLQDDGKNTYHVWQRWGRVGYNGQTNLVNCGGDLNAAKNTFSKKFRDKTGNDWALKDSFSKVPGKYDLLKMDYSAEDAEDQTDAKKATPDTEEEKAKVPDSKIDKSVQDLVKLICDVKSMEDAVIEMKYDAKKAPLGKLTKEQIKAGYTALKKIEDLINKNDTGRNLAEACSDFYTRIPHEFGMQTPPLIRTPQEVKKKIELLEALEDIEIAIKMLKGGDMSENPVDRHYHQLHCGLNPVKHGSEEFQLVDKYLQQTHASTHNQYKMQLLDVFDCDKEGEAANFQDYGNRMLLWHGSRLTNWAGILGQGLRIAPPEAPVTGYMFGKGVYFADMSSKSANYCFATKTKNVGLLLLCDVSLGNVNDKLAADYAANKLPAGKHSVRGLGMVAPDPTANVTLPDGLVVPVGKATKTGANNAKGYTLNYNEFIVYDTKQIRMKYLVKVKFNFK